VAKESGFIYYLRDRYPDFWCTKDFAKKIGRSAETVAMWRHRHYLLPSETVLVGQTTVGMYTKDDLARAGRLISVLGHGRRSAEHNIKLTDLIREEEARHGLV
jgi:hypothetical protein